MNTEAGTEAKDKKGGKGNGKSRTAAAGRKDANRQPAVKNPKIVSDRIEELIELASKAKTAGEKSAEAIAKCAEDSGYLAAAVRKLVSARLSEKFEEHQRVIDQQADLFDKVGE